MTQIGDKSPYEGDAVVAFLDILGFSARLRQTWGTEGGVLQKLLGLKSSLEPRTGGVSMAFMGSGLPPAMPEIALYSDSIIISCKVFDRRNVDSVNASVLITLACIGKAISYTASLGFGLRGGVDFGPIWWNGHEAIGPAFLDAYAIEQRVKSARVVVGPALIRQLLAVGCSVHFAEMIYRCEDNCMAVRPVSNVEIADPFESIRAVQDAAPDRHKNRYSEVLTSPRALPNVIPTLSLDELRSAAKAIENLCAE